MKYIFKIILFFTILVYNSCSNGDKKLVRKTSSDGSYLIVPYTIKNGDTILNGIGKRYSNNRELIDQFEFRDSKRNGWHYHYNSGKLISKIWFVNDSANGQGFFFDEGGIIESENFYFKGKLIVSKFFHPGGSVRLIDFFDNELAFYAINYDSLGKKINEKGVVFAHNFISNQNLDSIQINKPFELRIPIVLLPEYFTNIEIVKFNTKEDVYERTDSVPLAGYFALYKTSFMEPGMQMLGIAGELVDTNGIIIKRDTIYRKINVIK